MSAPKTIRTVAALLGLMLALGACVPERLYVWNSYEDDLYGYYKDSEKLTELMTALEQTIKDNEKAVAEGAKGADGKTLVRVAPGLYAEYGYLLLLTNRPAEAKQYFEKEKATWPESTVLMDRMIIVASKTPVQPPATGAAKAAMSQTGGATQ